MNKTQGYFIATAIVITLVYLMYGPSGTMGHKHSSPMSIDAFPEIPSSSTTTDQSTTSVNIETNKDMALDKQELLQSRIRNLQMPTVKMARQEVAKNPHVTPKTLIQSAYIMSTLFDDVHDEASAKLFLDKMRDCSSEVSDTPVAVKSSCVRYLNRLEKKFPQLKTDIDSARTHASEEALELEKLSR